MLPMAYLIRPVKSLEKRLAKIARKEPILYQQMMKKLAEISENPQRYKPMSNVLKGTYRVHIGHFVLLFGIDDEARIVELKDFDHHDKIYGN
jgi:mRNA-degrading endonuclease RelE of RelBE toxin-antitoxin system